MIYRFMRLSHISRAYSLWILHCSGTTTQLPVKRPKKRGGEGGKIVRENDGEDGDRERMSAS